MTLATLPTAQPSATKGLRTAFVLALLMGLAAIVGIASRPSTKADGGKPRYVLEAAIPKKFGDWTELPQTGVQVVNPQTKELLDKIYSQTLTRTYVSGDGYRIMLSLAYGDDQRGALQAHKPEVCYPAQGFTVHSNSNAELATPFGSIPVNQLSTSLGQRKEPVTYWFTIGNTTVKNRFDKRLAEIRLGLTGQVPDGLLFRVSSLDETPTRAFDRQTAFVSDLMRAVSPEDRAKLGGLVPAPQ
jgi:EpsI family protein